MGSLVSQAPQPFFCNDSFSIKLLMKVDMPLNKETIIQTQSVMIRIVKRLETKNLAGFCIGKAKKTALRILI